MRILKLAQFTSNRDCGPLVAALLLMLWVASCKEQAPPAQPQKFVVATAPVELADASFFTDSAPEYIAAVKANEETDLSFKIGGIVELIGPQAQSDWDEGVPVQAGRVLARLQQSDFRTALTTAKANAELAATTYDRYRKLLRSDAVSEQETDKAKADAESAAAKLQQAEQDLRNSELRAQKNSVVLKRYVNSGETVGAGKTVLRLGDLDTMSVELGVPDRVVNEFSVGKEIDMEVSAFPGSPPFRGRVSEVGVAAGQEGRLYRVVIKVPNRDHLLRSGMTATIRVGDGGRFKPGRVVVPLSALVTFTPEAQGTVSHGTRLAVFVVKGNKAERRPIKTGEIVRSSIIVSEGLEAGEEVVTQGTSFLYNGAPVVVDHQASAGE